MDGLPIEDKVDANKSTITTTQKENELENSLSEEALRQADRELIEEETARAIHLLRETDQHATYSQYSYIEGGPSHDSKLRASRMNTEYYNLINGILEKLNLKEEHTYNTLDEYFKEKAFPKEPL